MQWASIVEAGSAGVGALGLTAGVLYRKGRQEQHIEDRLAELSRATAENTAVMKELSETMRSFKEVLLNEISDLKTRVTVLEKLQQAQR